MHSFERSWNDELPVARSVGTWTSFVSSSVAAASANNKRSYEDAVCDGGAEQFPLPGLRRACRASTEADPWYIAWLEDVRSLVGACDAKLLRRYIPFMPLGSLRKVVNAFNYERTEKSQDHGVEEKISQRGMRIILATIFEA